MYEFKSENIVNTIDQLNMMINDVNRRIDFLDDDINGLRSRLEELWNILREGGLIDG